MHLRTSNSELSKVKVEILDGEKLFIVGTKGLVQEKRKRTRNEVFIG